MTMETRAIAALRLKREAEGLTDAAIGAKLGCHQSTVSRWFALHSKPLADMRDLIETHYKVPRGWWTQPASIEKNGKDQSRSAAPPPSKRGAHGNGRSRGSRAEVRP